MRNVHSSVDNKKGQHLPKFVPVDDIKAPFETKKLILQCHQTKDWWDGNLCQLSEGHCSCNKILSIHGTLTEKVNHIAFMSVQINCQTNNVNHNYVKPVSQHNKRMIVLMITSIGTWPYLSCWWLSYEVEVHALIFHEIAEVNFVNIETRARKVGAVNQFKFRKRLAHIA